MRCLKKGGRKTPAKYYVTILTLLGSLGRIRKIQLKKSPLCEMCQKEGRLTPANTCDHIDPTWESWQDFCRGPFQSLCGPCHKEKTEDDLPKLRKASKLKQEVF